MAEEFSPMGYSDDREAKSAGETNAMPINPFICIINLDKEWTVLYKSFSLVIDCFLNLCYGLATSHWILRRRFFHGYLKRLAM